MGRAWGWALYGFLPQKCVLLLPGPTLSPALLSQTMCSSENPIMSQCFDRSELSDKKRPETV